MKLVGAALVLAVVLLLSSYGKSSAYSIRVIHNTNQAVHATLGCQDSLGQAHFRTPGTYAKSGSMKFRLRALRLWRGRRAKTCGYVRWLNADPRRAIVYVFGRVGQAQKALSVVRCETGGAFNTNAQNGQYLGLFQMGVYARSRYGHSQTALGQTWSAFAYYQDAGWGPWECA